MHANKNIHTGQATGETESLTIVTNSKTAPEEAAFVQSIDEITSRGDLVKAAELLVDALDSTIDDSLRKFCHLKLAKLNTMVGNRILAIKHILAAFEVDPTKPTTYTRLLELSLSPTECRICLELLFKLADRPDSHPDICLAIGDLLLIQGEPREAFNYYQKASYLFTKNRFPEVVPTNPQLEHHILPDFLLTGALIWPNLNILGCIMSHPRIIKNIRSRSKYFSSPEIGKTIPYSINDYRTLFPSISDQFKERISSRDSKKIVGDVCGDAVYRPVLKFLLEELPNTKIVIGLQRPVDLVIQDYFHKAESGKEKRPIRYALLENLDQFTRLKHLSTKQILEQLIQSNLEPTSNGGNRYLLRGLISVFLEAWIETLPKSRVLFVFNDQHNSDVNRTLGTIQEFLGLPLHDLTPENNLRTSYYDPTLRYGVEDQLSEVFHPHLKRFFELTGVNLEK